MAQNPVLFLLPVDKKYLTGDISKPGPAVASTTVATANRSKTTVTTVVTLASTTFTTWWGDPNSTANKWLQCGTYVYSMVMLNIINPVGAGVKLEGSAADTWKFLTALHDVKTDLRLIHTEDVLRSIKYSDGQNIEAHFKAMRTAWAKANKQGADITDVKFHMYIIWSMPASQPGMVGALMELKTFTEVCI
ncbi:hypothetical protein C0995_011225 [Termitomyces sp. Mi166|nr:hypothetical protein C0995_011225 [Termitomyces sp. Mi166\